jgi:hypothetical protein
LKKRRVLVEPKRRDDVAAGTLIGGNVEVDSAQTLHAFFGVSVG